MKFSTEFQYTDRQSKAEYIYRKYISVLDQSTILDVGADQCYLKQHLQDSSSYWGIGLGGSPDQQVNLEKEPIPFRDNKFDCVLCLDVLEHLENIHQVFDELCRVSNKYVIISLPNPYADFWRMICRGDYSPGKPMKFYNLPLEPPEDRHKWFFSNEEAEKFIVYRAAKNNMKVLQMDNEKIGGEGSGKKGWLRIIARAILLRRDLNIKNLYASTLWAILQKSN